MGRGIPLGSMLRHLYILRHLLKRLMTNPLLVIQSDTHFRVPRLWVVPVSGSSDHRKVPIQKGLFTEGPTSGL